MSGKFKHRLRTSKNRARVAKGFSSNANPTKSRFRSAANASRIAYVEAESQIAVDERVPDPVMDQLNFDTMSIGKEPTSGRSMVSVGGMSAISCFTNCTNPAFDTVNRVWKSGSSMQSEVIAVLAAVADVIKESGGVESDVEYMKALLITLESSPCEDARRVAAASYLFYVIIRKVPKEVLQTNFSDITSVIYKKFLDFAKTSESSILKSLTAVLGHVLKAQPLVAWSSGETRAILVSICDLCTHERPWVRTTARKVVRTILTDPILAADNGLHPASAAVSQFVLERLESSLSAKKRVVMAIRYLCLLEGIMHKLPSTHFQLLSESILRSFAIADPTVKCSALQCFQRTLERQPSDAALSPRTAGLLLKSLRAIAPPSSDVTVIAHWMQALTEAQVCLSAKDPETCSSYLEETTILLTKLFDGAGEQLAQLTYQMLSRIIECCIREKEEPGKALLSLLHRSLHVRSAPVWRFVVRTIMRLFEGVGAGLIGQELADTLRTLAELRQSDTCMCKAELDFTVGSAIRHVGAGAVLAVIGLQLDPDAAVLPMDLPRSWLIPVLRVNLHNAPLSLLIKYFLPLAIKLHKRLPSLDATTGRLYTTVQQQLWDLLPAFLESPSDFSASYPTLAPILGAAIQERKDLRMVVLSSLRAALRFCQQPDAPIERVETMMREAGNFMPLLFNLYTNGGEENNEHDERGERMAALETIRLYADTTPRETVAKYIDNAMAKVQNESEVTKQSRILDIVAALLRNADVAKAEEVLQRILPWLEDKKKPSLQKKAYRILEEILSRGGATEFDTLLLKYETEIQAAVYRPISLLVPQARAAQTAASMRWLRGLVHLDEIEKFVQNVLPNVVQLLDKDNNVASRTNACKCLQDVCNLLIKIGTEKGEPTTYMLTGVLNGLFGVLPSLEERVTMHMARGSLVAFNILAQKYLRSLGGSDVARLVHHACAWIADERPPVKSLALRLLRMLMRKACDFDVQQHRELVLSSLFAQKTKDNTVKVRKANRLLLEVLVNRVGGPIVAKATDNEEWLKVLRSVEKQRRRRERIRNQPSEKGARGDEDGDDISVGGGSRTSARTAGADTILALLDDSDEDSASDEVKEEKKTRSRVGSVWLKQDGEERVMDLLDTKNLVEKVSTMDPALEERRKAKAIRRSQKKNSIEFTKDGKLLINFEDEDKWKRKEKKDREEDIHEEEDETITGSADERGAKRRRIENDSDDEGESGMTGYRCGGRGIHRKTSASVISGAPSAVTRNSMPKNKRNNNDREKGRKSGGQGGAKVQPYAYVPLQQIRKNGAKQLKSIIGRKRKAKSDRSGTTKAGSHRK